MLRWRGRSHAGSMGLRPFHHVIPRWAIEIDTLLVQGRGAPSTLEAFSLMALTSQSVQQIPLDGTDAVLLGVSMAQTRGLSVGTKDTYPQS